MTDKLSYWDEISSYLNVSNKTAQRYFAKGMPVKHDAAGHPYITKQAADKWMFSNNKKKCKK